MLDACNQDVQQLLAVMGADGSEPVLRPSWPFREPGSHPGADAALPLRDALTSCYDIRCAPGMYWLEHQLAVNCTPIDAELAQPSW